MTEDDDDDGPIVWACKACGSTDIVAHAFARWNAVKQGWELVPNCIGEPSDDQCNQCNDARETEERPITDVKVLAQIAIKKAEAT